MKKLIALLFLIPALCFGQMKREGIKKDGSGLEGLPSFRTFIVTKQKCMETNIEEIWKDIAGYEGYYQVSNLGNVRSLDRKIDHGLYYSTVKGKSMPIRLNKKGYPKVALTKGTVFKQPFIHRLVCIAFVPNPENKPQVNHIDGNKLNNHVSNLEWVTNLENTRHSYKYLNRAERMPKAGPKHPSNRPVNQYDLNGNLLGTFYSATKAGKDLNLRLLGIARCARGERKTYAGFKWEYI